MDWFSKYPFRISSCFLISVLVLISGCTILHRMTNSKRYDFISADRKSNGIIFVNNTTDECWIFIMGSISHDTLRAFRLAADDADQRKCSIKWVILESGGGEVRPSMEIGRIIRSRNYFTTLPKVGGICTSSCGLIFISGVRREIPTVLLDSKIGFHQPYRKGPNEEKICAKIDDNISNAFLTYARSMLSGEAAEKFHQNSMKTVCTGVTFFRPKELISNGIATGIGGPDTF